MATNKAYDDVQLDVEFTQASTRVNLVSKENISISFGKISKYFADLHSQAFTGYTHPTYTARTGKPTGNQTPAFGATFTISQITSDGTGHVTAATDRTVKIPDTTMGAATADTAGSIGLVPAPAAGKQSSFLRGDGTWAAPTNTDTLVSQTFATESYKRPLLMSYYKVGEAAGTAQVAYRNNAIFANPNTGRLYATKFYTNGWEASPATTSASLQEEGLVLRGIKTYTNGKTFDYNRYVVKTYSGKTALGSDGSSSGMLLTVESGGLTIIGGGESARSLADQISDDFYPDASDPSVTGNSLDLNGNGDPNTGLHTSLNGASENLILSSDNNIYFVTKCNTIAERQSAVFTTGLSFYPLISGTGSIGHSSYQWGAIRGVTIYENGTSLASKYAAKATTLNGYGITDAKIVNGVITLGSNTITPLTSHQTVTDKNVTLEWETQKTVATIGSTDIHVTLPANPDITYSAGNHLALSGTTFKVADYCKTITDWNSATTNGWYMGSSVANAPSTAWWFGRVIAHNNKYCLQEAWQFSMTNTNKDAGIVPHKIRLFLNNAWGSWVDACAYHEGSGGRSTRSYDSGLKLKIAQTTAWAMGLKFVDSSDATVGFMGAYGQSAGFESFRFGSAYDAPWLKIDGTDGLTVAKNVYLNSKNANLYIQDSTSTKFALIGYNGSNLWIGASASNYYHHKGGTYISTGWSGTLPTAAGSSLTGNSSVYISIPTYTVDENGTGSWSHNSGEVLHSRNYTSYTYSATTSRTKNTVLAAPNGSNGAATFRALVAADLPNASTSAYGITKLSSSTSSTSTELAATPSAVKSAYDLAAGKSTVSFSRNLTSGTKVGTITIDGNSTDLYCQTNTNTDTLVSQTFASADHNRPLLMSYYYTGDETTTAQVVHRNDALYFNPNSGILRSPRLYLQTTGMPITINLDTLQPTAGENVNVLAVRYKNTDGTATHTVYPIGILGNDATGSSPTVNSGVRLGSTNGTTIVGAGESSTTFAAAQAKYNDENLYFVADGAVYMYTNCSNDSTTVTGPWRVGGFTTGTSAITSGRVMITDGTAGGFKASDYTIAKSVPSDAKFTDTTYSAGTGLSLSGTTFNHSNSVTAKEDYNKKFFTHDSQGHITETSWYIHKASGTNGSNDDTTWIKIATLVHTSTYNNAPITVTFTQRGSTVRNRLTIRFSSVNSNDPSLTLFLLTCDALWASSNSRALIVKTATSTWDVYIKKLDTHEVIHVSDFDIGSTGSTKLTWTWKDEQVTTTPADATEATKKVYSTTDHTHSQYYDSTISRTKNTVLAAPNGSNGAATFRALVAADLPSHTHSDYVLKTGDTMSGNLTLSKSSGDTYYYAERTDTGVDVRFGVGSSGTNHGIYSGKLGGWMIYGDATDVSVRARLYNPSTEASLYALPLFGGTPSTGGHALYNNNGFRYSTLEGTTSALGVARLVLGNGTASGTAANKRGSIRLYSEKQSYVDLIPESTASASALTVPAIPEANADVISAERSSLITDSSAKETVNAYPWHKFAEITITTTNQDENATFLVSLGYGRVTTEYTGILKVHLRTGSDKTLAATESTMKWLVAGACIDPENFVMKWTNTSGTSAVVELWMKMRTNGQYDGWTFKIIKENTRTTKNTHRWTLVDGSGQGATTHGGTIGTDAKYSSLALCRNVQGVYTVIGTQTASTSAWTGKLDIPDLYDGLTIAYYLPYASTSTSVTLNLTLLSTTGTSETKTTGAINCYSNSTTRITTHYGAGSTILLTYWSAGSISVSGTPTTEARWTRCDYNADTKTRQTLASGNSNRPLLMSYGTTSTTDSNVDNVAYRNNSIYANPSTGTITATKFNGNITGSGLNAGIYELLNVDNPVFDGAEWMLTSIPSSSGGTSEPSFRRVKTEKFADYVNSTSRKVLFDQSTNTSASVSLSAPPADTEYLKLYFRSSGNNGQTGTDTSVYSIAEVPYMTGVNLGGILQVAQNSDNSGIVKFTALAFNVKITSTSSNYTLTLTKAPHPSRIDGTTVTNDLYLSANIIKVVAYR